MSNFFEYQEKSLLQVRPISSEEERLQIYEEAQKDGGRNPLMPTHVVKKGGVIVGAFCLYSPTVYWWMHTQRTKVRDSLSLFQTISALLANDGVVNFILPCESESPFFPILSKKLKYFCGVEGDDLRLFINKG